MKCVARTSSSSVESALKRRKISRSGDSFYLESIRKVDSFFPALMLPGYFVNPNFHELAARELEDPGYCSRVENFTVGRSGYGCVKFLGHTDVRWLDLNEIVKFGRHEVVVYEEDNMKPRIGEGLNKPSEVTLVLQVDLKKQNLEKISEMLKLINQRQGAQFITFDRETCEWRFSVFHFSRFGLSEEEEADIMMDDVNTAQHSNEMDDHDVKEDSLIDDRKSLIVHKHMDPSKTRDIRMLMFTEAEGTDGFDAISPQLSSDKRNAKSSLKNFTCGEHGSSPLVIRKSPRPLIEYNKNVDQTSPGTILLFQQSKDKPVMPVKVEGFKLDMEHTTPTVDSYSKNIVDAALFMGRSFRVGWGPNGVLAHCGTPLSNGNSKRVLSSVISLEKVAFDNVVRNEDNKVAEELVDLMFDSPLRIHKDEFHEVRYIDFGSFKLKLLKPVSNRTYLPKICQSYIDIIARQMEVPGLSSSIDVSLRHQITVWDLIKVLFTVEDSSTQFKFTGVDNDDDMVHDGKEVVPEDDPEALPLIRRGRFSYWLQGCVSHAIQVGMSLSKDNYLMQIFVLLTGRMLDSAVQLAASRGDVRLSCLLSQAGGSVKNRSLVTEQLTLWKSKRFYFDFIEVNRVKIYELLAGNIDASPGGFNIDWKRYLGLLMWYQLPPDAPLHIIFDAYKNLLDNGKAPCPVPVYIDENSTEDTVNYRGDQPYDITYYLMFLHANEDFMHLRTMFSACCSTPDPFDFHMIWHQKEVLEAVGIFTSNDLNLLDMGFVNQLLCVGLCHWAIYVVLHMPYLDDFPYIQPTVIKQILFQYCEIWSAQDAQRQFIEDLGIPSTWLHEAMAVYYNYHSDLPQSMHHFIKCEKWQKAHSIFITAIAPSLFLSGNDVEISEVLNSMEDHKSEIGNWDLGAGVYVSFYQLKDDLKGISMTDSDFLECKNSDCREFFDCLNESLAVLDSSLPLDARVAYSQMAEQISTLLLSANSEAETRELQFSCFETIFEAPISGATQSSCLQDAVSLFTTCLAEKTRSFGRP